MLPSCLQHTSKASVLLKNIAVDADQEKLLAELAETLIPATDTPGAKDVSAHLFVLTMMDDCSPKAAQQQWLNGLQQFDQLAKQTHNQSFVQSNTAQREALLASLEAKKDAKGDVSFFYHTTKSLVIRAYTNSKYYLTKVQVYELVPSRFKGCVPV